MKSPVRILMTIAILLAAATVAAQVYRWVDKDGRVQFTDTPPPADTKIDAKKVDIKPASGAKGAAPANSKSPADTTKDASKRRADAAAKEKKSAEAEEEAKANADNCATAKRNLADLQSGRPISRTDETGGIKLLDDDERKADMERARSIMAQACK